MDSDTAAIFFVSRHHFGVVLLHLLPPAVKFRGRSAQTNFSMVNYEAELAAAHQVRRAHEQLLGRQAGQGRVSAGLWALLSNSCHVALHVKDWNSVTSIRDQTCMMGFTLPQAIAAICCTGVGVPTTSAMQKKFHELMCYRPMCYLPRLFVGPVGPVDYRRVCGGVNLDMPVWCCAGFPLC
jgi:hypothetical protein